MNKKGDLPYAANRVATILIVILIIGGVNIYLLFWNRYSKEEIVTNDYIEYIETHPEQKVFKFTGVCNSEEWCNIPMPSVSYFGFEPPKDEERWKEAKYLASIGDQVLLRKIAPHFPNPFDFLDGDKTFKKNQEIIDINANPEAFLAELGNDAESPYKLTDEQRTKRATLMPPANMLFKEAKRYPIVSLGYAFYERVLDG